MLDAYSQLFKRFKDGFFKVVVKPAGQEHFYGEDGKPKFPFYWRDNPWRYEDMTKDMLSKEDRRIVGILEKFPCKLPTKSIVRVYLSTQPVIELQGNFKVICFFILFS